MMQYQAALQLTFAFDMKKKNDLKVLYYAKLSVKRHNVHMIPGECV